MKNEVITRKEILDMIETLIMVAENTYKDIDRDSSFDEMVETLDSFYHYITFEYKPALYNLRAGFVQQRD